MVTFITAIIINLFNNCCPTMPKLHAFYKKSTDIISTIVFANRLRLEDHKIAAILSQFTRLISRQNLSQNAENGARFAISSPNFFGGGHAPTIPHPRRWHFQCITH